MNGFKSTGRAALGPGGTLVDQGVAGALAFLVTSGLGTWSPFFAANAVPTAVVSMAAITLAGNVLRNLLGRHNLLNLSIVFGLAFAVTGCAPGMAFMEGVSGKLSAAGFELEPSLTPGGLSIGLEGAGVDVSLGFSWVDAGCYALGLVPKGDEAPWIGEACRLRKTNEALGSQ